ncbi:response regulator [Luteimonas weifangensis]|uniref:Sensory/regulatory protein RpfC n=1 Tax=Cognatiluteimonas weifangensis TaxID=2303539 RepID=A0A372DPJ8_9GAMM|nr:response regulator [Luteimonas weifangensis]
MLALFGLLLLAGAAVLLLDEIAQHRARQSLRALETQSLGRLHALKAVADGYSLGVVDTTFKVRNYLIDWPDGVAALDRAHAAIQRHWRELEAMPRTPAQQRLFAQTAQARLRADRATVELRAILVQQDIAALGRFADGALYPAIDPVATRLQTLSDQAMLQAQAKVRAEVRRGYRDSALRIGLSLLALLVATLAGQRILRDAYRGIEALTRLAQRMREHDYVAAPGARPRGEFGEVMDAFLDMRSDVLKFEAELTDQLVRNERVREALEQREAFQRSLLDAAQTAIVAADEHGTVTRINPFAERLLGWPAADLLGRRQLHELFEPDSLQALAQSLSRAGGGDVAPGWDALQRLAARKQAPREMALRNRRGRALPVLLALSPMHDDAGQPLGLLLVATDLSALKRLEHALRDSEARAREANHAKSAFLAAMSHEIRTPMIGVTGMVEVLSHTALDTEQRRALNVIQSSAQSLLQIIGDILDFSKIEAGRLDLQPAATSLARVLHSVVANFSGSASSKGLTLTCSVDERVPPAHYADALRLRQILGNFLSNAIKFTEAGSVQAVLEWRGGDPRDDLAHGRDLLSFRVTDTGIGISEEAQARLFQPFSQAEGDTTRRFGGTGLGLAICRRLAELMGGEVGLESVPGLGTTLRLTLTLPRAPLAEVGPEAAAAPAATGLAVRRLPTVAEAERERSLVLLVDDHPTNRMVIARQLALAGYASEAAEDGAAGLEQWRSGRFALLLSDVHMPRLDGYELARRIRAEEARDGRARTPIVALTASALKGEAERCLAAGMDDYLAKPVGIPALTAALRRWLPHTAPPEPAADAAPAPLPQLAHPPALDPATLDALTGGDPAEARTLLDDFLASTAQDLAALEAACAAGDLAALTRQAHKIKGAARMIGAPELAQTAAALEAAGRGGTWAPLPSLAADLATAAERLRRYVGERYPR